LQTPPSLCGTRWICSSLGKRTGGGDTNGEGVGESSGTPIPSQSGAPADPSTRRISRWVARCSNGKNSPS
jgi:hypothetical protein